MEKSNLLEIADAHFMLNNLYRTLDCVNNGSVIRTEDEVVELFKMVADNINNINSLMEMSR